MSWTTLGDAVVAGLAGGAFYALLALSFAAILALGRALNLAHGEWVLLGGYVGYAAARAWGWPLLAVVPAAAVALVPAGLAWRALLARVREPVELQSMVLTFGLALLLQDALAAVFTADYRVVVAPGGARTARVVAAGLGLVALPLLQWWLLRTRQGTAVRATARDPEIAGLLGVDTDRLAAAGFAVAAAVAGAGGALFAGFHYLQPGGGIDLTLLAITLAVLGRAWGGRAAVLGLLGAGLAVGLVEALTLAWAGPRWREPVLAALLLAALLARPSRLSTGGAS